MSKVKCMICGKEFEKIMWKHLQIHNVTREEYIKKFPNALLISEEFVERMSKARIEKEPTSAMIEGWKKAGKSNKILYENPTEAMILGYKKNSLTHLKYYQNHPETKKQRSEKMIIRCQNPTEAMIKSYKKISVSNKARAKNPTEAMIEGHKKAGKSNKGKVRTQSAKDKLSKAQKIKGKHPTPAMIEGRKRTIEKNKGKHRSQVSKDKSSISNKANWLDEEFRAAHSGENANNYKGGISNLPYCEKFDEDLKERVREYFDRCCYVCGKNEIDNGEKLSVHHVNYDKMVCCNDVKPLFVPLCRSCHMKTHDNREEWEDFFTVSLKYLTDGKCFYTKEEMIK